MEIVNAIVELLGVEQATLLGILGFIAVVCQLIAKLIPDNATGVLGLIRKVCKVVGLYVPNRVTDTTDVTTPAKQMARLR